MSYVCGQDEKKEEKGHAFLLFGTVTQATEEAVDNALVAAKTMTGANY